MTRKTSRSLDISAASMVPMHVEIRLKEVMIAHNLHHHGALQRMARATRLSRHTVRRLFRGEAAVVSMETLGLVSGYLYACGVTTGLPGLLFVARPTRLIDALAAHRHVMIYLADYHRRLEEPHRSWVARDDAAVLARLFGMLSRLEAERPLRVTTEYVRTHLPPEGSGLGPAAMEEDIRRAKDLFAQMRSQTGGGSVIVGSQRANPMAECFVCELFHCTPFAAGRSPVPFYLKYQEDARGPSSFGGDDPPTGEGPSAPAGIYYQRAPGSPWEFLPSEPGKRGAGGVILRRDVGTGKLEILVFGLSAISTAAMGKIIDNMPGSFWFTGSERSGIQVAVFLCGFELSGMETGEESIDELSIGDPKIILLELRPARRRGTAKSKKRPVSSRAANGAAVG